jgi:hypothetical protein
VSALAASLSQFLDFRSTHSGRWRTTRSGLFLFKRRQNVAQVDRIMPKTPDEFAAPPQAPPPGLPPRLHLQAPSESQPDSGEPDSGLRPDLWPRHPVSFLATRTGDVLDMAFGLKRLKVVCVYPVGQPVAGNGGDFDLRKSFPLLSLMRFQKKPQGEQLALSRFFRYGGSFHSVRVGMQNRPPFPGGASRSRDRRTAVLRRLRIQPGQPVAATETREPLPFQRTTCQKRTRPLPDCCEFRFSARHGELIRWLKRGGSVGVGGAVPGVRCATPG